MRAVKISDTAFISAAVALPQGGTAVCFGWCLRGIQTLAPDSTHSAMWNGYRLISKNESVSHKHQYTQQVTSLLYTVGVPQKQHRTVYLLYPNERAL